MLVSGVVADSFAGERERHTLETLLASRLSDQSILAGKLVAAVGYAWGFTMVMVLVSLASVNVLHWQGGMTWFPVTSAVGIPIVSLLTSLLAAAAGVLVSLRSPSVRQAAQMLSIGVMLLLFVPMFAVRSLPPEWRHATLRTVLAFGPWGLLAALALVVATLDAVLVALAALRFRRARLILD
jgi:ABC-2 type transport system permease protein